ncbi:sulfatase-like hydrolase/transferase [Saccharicrinis fermentans]|uniref:Beta-glucanase n=1 Tax=Saccharicrinis fermentans DSM 9555 = JCM 21142 TaxID=869213 RepID=W7XXT7_9BACT|nr:sulfatase-like hydrolase/transferase [Saccharicrinis fermentans]GAF03315.1 beta-glucanase precursor [Saccharicrinis fermentans DSM 9555 = JCM 21142]
MKKQYDGYRTKLMRNNGRVEEGEYITDALSREAVSFIQRKANEPFFIYLAYNAPHGPLQATEKYLKRFDHITDKKRKTYAAMVSAVDDGVGLLLNKLDELQLTDNTMVFFLSDNGGPEHHNASDNGVLREGKSSLYEGGIHVPFAMQWPGKIPSGMVYDKPVISLDIFATAAHYAGATAKNELDGVNIIPYVKGEKKELPHDYLCWRKFDTNDYAIVNGDNKVVKYRTDKDAFYNLKDDIGETTRLPLTEKYQAAKVKYEEWQDEMKNPVFLGLMQDKEYTRLNPNRFIMVNPYKPDSLEASEPEHYELVWADEFDEDGKPNEKYWSYEKGFVRNNELQWYQPDNAKVKEGLLIIEGKREKVKNTFYEKGSNNWRKNRKYAAYTSACIKTVDKFSFQYGIMEVRARIDTSMGMWPAIWTLGVHKPWPANGEVDQMEYYRHNGEAKILANAAWASQRGRAKWDSEKIPLSEFVNKQPDWERRFHVWKMHWTEDFIRLYLDDELLNEIDLSQTINADGSNPFHQAQYILLNLAIGARGGDPSQTIFPRKYEVDYVRVFQKKISDK